THANQTLVVTCVFLQYRRNLGDARAAVTGLSLFTVPYDQGQSLALFKWNGEKAESGYRCPSIAEIAAVLEKNA
ncbi:hypothetical protein QCD79_32830, partial [Pseudomonas quasicaspiana]|nr:hypothetical protein [Pseudomonas quasicaspiana]